MPGWKFLTNHALVLCLIAQQPRITAREISSYVGITEKATRNIINDLEDLPLRHEFQQDKAIGDLLEVLGWKRRKPRARKKAPPPETG